MTGNWLLMTFLMYGLPMALLASVMVYVYEICDRRHWWRLVWLGLISHACVGVLTYSVVTDLV